MKVYLLQRRGQADGVRAVVVVARSEAHARVTVADRAEDVTWGEEGHATCRVLSDEPEGSIVAIHALPNAA